LLDDLRMQRLAAMEGNHHPPAAFRVNPLTGRGALGLVM
jgi:hypothetical protein